MHDFAASALAASPRLPLAMLERLFDALPDVVFFAKDAEGRYTHANQTLLDRLRLTKRAQLVGRRSRGRRPARAAPVPEPRARLVPHAQVRVARARPRGQPAA